MATLNSLDLARPVLGQQPSIARAVLTAVAADDTANSFTVDFSSKLKAVDSFMAAHRSSNGQLKATRVQVSGTTFTVTDGSTDTIAANDVITIWAEGPIA